MGLLGSMLLNPDALRLGLDLRPDDFYRTGHKKIFVGMKALSTGSNPVDLISLTDWLQQAGELDEAGGAAYVTSLLDTPVPSNAAHYAKIVLRDAHKRRLLEEGHRFVESASNGQLPAEVTAKMIERLRELDSEFISPLLERGSWEKRILTAPELLDSSKEDQAWYPLWGQIGLIGPGLVTMLSGHSKVAGKSTSLSIGIRELVRESPNLRVLFFTEEPESLWKRRLSSWGSRSENLGFRFGNGTPWPALLREAEEFKPNLLVVDTLRSFLNFEDENDASRVVVGFQPLVQLSRRGNIAVLGTHHLRKSDAESGLAHSGSTALVALCDIALELRQESDHSPNRRTLKSVSRFDETPKALMLELRGGDIVPLGTPAAVSLNEVTARVQDALSREEWLTTKAVHQSLGDPRPAEEQVRRSLLSLHADDRIERRGDGKRGSPHEWKAKDIYSPTTPSSHRRNELGSGKLPGNVTP